MLSGIILVALKGMYTQAAELKRYHREGLLESMTWIITFGAVVLVDVDIGYVITRIYILVLPIHAPTCLTRTFTFQTIFRHLCVPSRSLHQGLEITLRYSW